MDTTSSSTIQRKLHELNDRYFALKKAVEVEEATYDAISNSGLETNKQYVYSQSELSKIEDRRTLALNELDVKFNTFKEKKEGEIKRIQQEMERYIEAYKAKKEGEIKSLEQEIETKEAAIEEKKALKEKGYDTQIKTHQETCEKIAEKAGVPTAIGYHRKRADLEIVRKQIAELENELNAANDRNIKNAKEECDRRLAEEKRAEQAQRSLDYSKFLATKAAEKEADERKATAREERKKKLRDALRRCTTEDDVWDVENDQDYLDGEDEELIASYKKRLQERAAKSDNNSIVDTGNPLANSTYIPSAPVASHDVLNALGTAKLLQNTKTKMMGKQLMRR